MSNFAPSHSRGINTVRGIGYGEVIAELVPGNEDAVTIGVTRTCLYTAYLMQVFGYRGGSGGLVRALRQHRWPFDVRQEQLIHGDNPLVTKELGDRGNVQPFEQGLVGKETTPSDSSTAIVTYYLNCWLNSYSRTVNVDTTAIVEEASITCTWVTSETGLNDLHSNDTEPALRASVFKGGQELIATTG
jgi:hypothetical protein